MKKRRYTQRESKLGSRTERSDTHTVQGPNGLWFENEDAAERYRAHRNECKRARSHGFQTDEYGLEEFRKWEEKNLLKNMSDKAKVLRIRRMIEKGDLTASQFTLKVIDIIEAK